jgi:para-aminobenzoate synthetase
MEILEELEQDAEPGPYSGSLGYISINGCMDMNIITQTAVLTLDEAEDAWKVSVSTSGAITAQSNGRVQ